MRISMHSVFFVVLGLFSACFAGTYSGGSGIDGDPYVIAVPDDWTELMNTSADWGSYFSQEADIDLAGRSTTSVGNSTTQFTGFYDGNGNDISNYSVNSTSSYTSPFGYIGSAGQVQNVCMIDCDITGGYYTGGIAGRNSGAISNCIVTGNVSGSNYVGGLIGINYGTTVTDCSVLADVSGIWYVGGLIGQSEAGNITFSHADCTLDVDRDCCGGLIGKMLGGSVSNCSVDILTTDSSTYSGGLVGKNENGGPISDCYVCAEIQNAGKYTGGLVGYNQGVDSDITNCYATATINSVSTHIGGLTGNNLYATLTNCVAVGSATGNGYVGGLVGRNDDGHILYCYASGEVNSNGNDNAGGLVGFHYGYNRSGSIRDCYSTGTVYGGNYVGGLVGYNRYGKIYNSYTAGVGDAAGYNAASFCGYQYGSTCVMQNCFWEGEGSGYTVNSSYPGTITNVVSLTSEQIRTAAPFTNAGWDFTNVWWINEERDYPKLAFQPYGDLNNDCFVNIQDIAIMSAAWDTTYGDANYNRICELSGDTTVDDSDLAELAYMWLEGPQW